MLNELTSFRTLDKPKIQIIDGFYSLTRKCESTSESKNFQVIGLIFLVKSFGFRRQYSGFSL